MEVNKNNEQQEEKRKETKYVRVLVLFYFSSLFFVCLFVAVVWFVCLFSYVLKRERKHVVRWKEKGEESGRN